MISIENVQKLIQSHYEGDYWDFKQEPHSNNSDLLHDIICMANSLSENNKYIIFGVKDPNDGCEVLGLDNQTLNRKNQQQFIDFLRTKKFAGEIRPEIFLRTYEIENKEIDILEIIEKKNKPYYLVEDCNGIKANYIYTRIGDTNTPKNKSADLYIVEKMWRQRFGIDLTPIEKINLLLEEDNWVIDPGNKNYGYHELFPIYQLKFSKCRKGKETYSYYYPNSDTWFGTIYIKYYNIILKEIPFCWLDGYRYPMVLPMMQTIEHEEEYYGFYYFKKDSIEWKLTKILGTSVFEHRRRELLPYIFFEDDYERNEFVVHINQKINEIMLAEPGDGDVRKTEKIQADGINNRINPIFIGKIVREYYLWKDSL